MRRIPKPGLVGFQGGRSVEASIAIEAERALASAVCMELAINRGSGLTEQPGDRERGDRHHLGQARKRAIAPMPVPDCGFM